MAYERTDDFYEWCSKESVNPVWLRLYNNTERCVMSRDPFPFFTELQGVVIDLTYRYNELVTDRSFLICSDHLMELLDFVEERCSGRFTLIERNGYEGVLFDLGADYLIVKLAFGEHQAVIERSNLGRHADTIRRPSSWHPDDP